MFSLEETRTHANSFSQESHMEKFPPYALTNVWFLQKKHFRKIYHTFSKLESGQNCDKRWQFSSALIILFFLKKTS